MAMIYEPKGRAREYAALSCNVYRGCDHNCSYCYAPSATFTSRDAFAVPRSRGDAFLTCVERESFKLGKAGSDEKVLLSFTCDPYQSFDVECGDTRRVIKMMKRNGMSVQVLTKGGTRAIRDIDLFGPGDAFATTMTCLDDSESIKFEPGAALPDDRIRAIKEFHAAGIETWVSLEPVLDPAVSLELIKVLAPIVDLFKVGTLNYSKNNTDWGTFGRSARALLNQLGKAHYIKKDLLKHMS